MDIALFFSTMYAILITIGYIPGLKSLVKDRNVDGVSRWFWYLIITTVGISFYNLLHTESTNFQIISVGINLLLGIVCLLVVVFRKKDLFIFVFIVILSLFLFTFGSKVEVTQTVATLSIILAYISQIIQFYKTKQSDGTNKWLYLIIGFAIGLLSVSMVLTNTTPHIVITELVNMLLILICYFQADFYEKRGRNRGFNKGFKKGW
ncbi:putative membrane protein [Staphylococcus phage Twort]|uniref:ORF061 n=2 Tax=Staphylococcus phage Twort (strain DSM 17442 / HER 48) TaxID=2908167 RepID=Q4Z904_BPTWO|nr:hypothetical protein TwortORF061 [Staphylococcus phage Twort]AAX92356.1 ORF061 [Staphylococcus phage Twort]QIW89061.1 putative membrane protein [Staphylococcus phage Twort]